MNRTEPEVSPRGHGRHQKRREKKLGSLFSFIFSLGPGLCLVHFHVPCMYLYHLSFILNYASLFCFINQVRILQFLSFGLILLLLYDHGFIFNLPIPQIGVTI